ncbi:MAG: SWIM zinc finger family protein [Chitinispirillaceae bacterium]|nr:SWIM zinc finger family protein [Chitinispirillaceae bacterium]
MGRYDYDGYGGYPPYVSKAEKIALAEKTRAKMEKKGVHLEPVIVEGRTITKTWWGKGWVQNLERYADYSNRLPRGRSYLRNGSILDLKIEKNKVSALVSGSRSTPYKIDITIASLNRSLESELMKESRNSLDSMQSLLSGEFPEELKEDFFKKDSGLFPSPKEIKLDCSCPDWASMCKHVAAALYGVAVRLDEKPELFFILRGIDINSFVAEVAKEETEKLLKKADAESNRVLGDVDSDDEMGALFGIAFESADSDSDSTDVVVGKKVHKENHNKGKMAATMVVKKAAKKAVKKAVKKVTSKRSVKKVAGEKAGSTIDKVKKNAKKIDKTADTVASRKKSVPAKKVKKKKT